MSLSDVRLRLAELVEKLPFEMDIDTKELEEMNGIILHSASVMTPVIAMELKKNIDEIQVFVDHQKDRLNKLLNGVATGQKAIGQYKQQGLKRRSKFVFQKA